MKINTSRFGEISIDEDKILTLKDGLLGFSNRKKFTILDHPTKKDAPFRWLQSLDDPTLAFVITDPLLFKTNYQIEIGPDDANELELTDVKEAVLAVIVNIPAADPSKMTANLQGPLIINSIKKFAKQVVLMDGQYPCRYQLLAQPG